ncbi:MAG: methyltransferase [Pseudonocardia sp.]
MPTRVGVQEGDAMQTTARFVSPLAERAESPHQRLARLADGFLSTQLLVAAAELGIADALADGPRTADDLAAELRADPTVLHRLLRGLAADGVLREHRGGRFGLTDTGELMRSARYGSQRGSVLARGRLYYAAASGVADAVRGGGVPFERVHGEPFFARLSADPQAETRFHASMLDRSRREADAVVEAYDFTGIPRIVDVGGGAGVLLATILAAATPGTEGVLFDRPTVCAQTGPGAWTVEAGDFFAAVPPGDAHVLSRVLHDWDDADASRILRACRAAMPAHGRLVIVEAVLPERAAQDPATTRMDLLMLVLLGGRERTEAEFRTLLGAAGFALTRVAATSAGVSVLEARPA